MATPGKFSANCSVSGCEAKREREGYCLPHYLQHKSSGDGASAPKKEVFNPYTEFKEFSRKEIQDYTKQFKGFDIDGDGEIDFRELTQMMEKLKQPQTHIGLKAILKEVDEDHSGGISLREFMLIFRKVRTGEIKLDSLVNLAKSIDVAIEGVSGAKNFFEAHANKHLVDKQREDEIKQEQVQKKVEREQAATRKAAFKDKLANFN